MEKKLANIFSTLFNPVLIPFYGSLIILFSDGYLSLLLPAQARLMILGIIVLMTVLMPAVTIFLMKKTKMISSIRLEKREERAVPFLATGFSFYLAYMLIKSFEIPGYYGLFLLGATLLIVLALVINSFWKISIHMMALGGLTGLFIALSPFVFGVDEVFTYLLIFISGLTGFARLKLNVHTPAQVYTGWFTGVAFMFGLFQLLV
ncbi:MAG: hypothetical protein K9I29_01395 [Bacteroidales bacterium]|nr:hypothetical protein [Bacteroidales bacterium]MCF8326924.1 hypothetical protein [Bacteroidales bacterium]